MSVLTTPVYGALTGGSHRSDAELRNTVGQGHFFPPSPANLMPMQSLRDAIRVFRLLLAFPIAVLRGFLYRCFICGNRQTRLWADGCLKAFRFRVGTSNVVYWLPNSVMLDARRIDAAVRLLQFTREKRVDACCKGDTGVTRLRAAAERPARKPIDQHGMYACACGHECCECAFEMHRPESVSGHQTLALLYAALRGCKILQNDTMCILLAHLRKLGIRNLEPILRALSGLSPEDADGAMAVLLSVPDGPFASFQFDASGLPPSDVDAATFDRRVPSLPSHFDLAELVKCFVARAQAGSQPHGELVKVFGAIPSLHSFMHGCRQVHGTPATPGVGDGAERSEHLNSQTLSRYGPLERTKTATNYRLSTGTTLALFNQKKALDVAHDLVAFHVRALMSLHRQNVSLGTLRDEYIAFNPSADVSDAALARLSERTRAMAARGIGQSEAASDARSERNQMKLAIKARQLSGIIRVLRGIRDDVKSAGGGAEAQDAMVITFISTSVVKLPPLRSLRELKHKIVSQNQALAALRNRLRDFVFNPNSAIALHLSRLHDLSAELAQTNVLIDLHVASRGGKDASSAALYKSRGSTLKKMEGAHGLLKQLLPLSPDDRVKSFKLPDIRSISGPESLPNVLGSVVVVPGDVALGRLIDAFNARRGAVDELLHLRQDAECVLGNIDAVLDLLASMLRQLACDEPDLARGAGPSGLWGGPADAMFDLSRIEMSTDSKREVAAGIAFHIAQGLETWRAQRVQVCRGLEGLSLLLQPSSATSPAVGVELSTDECGRAHAMRYVRRLLRGDLSPADWAAVSRGTTLPRGIRRPTITVTYTASCAVEIDRLASADGSPDATLDSSSDDVGNEERADGSSSVLSDGNDNDYDAGVDDDDDDDDDDHSEGGGNRSIWEDPDVQLADEKDEGAERGSGFIEAFEQFD